MEPLLEQILETGSEFLACKMDAVFGLGGKVVELGVEPGGFVGDLAIVHVVSQLNEQRERYVSRSDLALAGNGPAAGFRVGVRGRRLDRSDLKYGVWSLRCCWDKQEQPADAAQEQ